MPIPRSSHDAASAASYILDPWYPRVSSIWGPSDAPGNFEDAAEMERNWPAYRAHPATSDRAGLDAARGRYPDRDGLYVFWSSSRSTSAREGT